MDYMEQALSLARLALGYVSPNPAVGAVIVKDGNVIGQGYTQPPGLDHAEVQALKEAGEAARDGTMYVTLEPCCGFDEKRTPPCADAIIQAGIKEVHMSMLDPNPKVTGHGKQALEQAGIRTFVGESAALASEINEAYIKYITTGMPFVTTKFAISLDGKIATKTHDSKWISSIESRRVVHNLRYRNDAIMAGINTVLTDNPHLTIRFGGGKGGTTHKQPLRVIVDGNGRIPLNAQVFNEYGKTLVALGKHATEAEKAGFARAGADIVELPQSSGIVDLDKLFRHLGQRQITSVLVEGGGKLFGSLFDCGLVDKVIVFIAPIIVGGQEAVNAVGGIGADKIADSLRLERIKVTSLGEDIMVTGYVSGKKRAGCSPA